MGRSLPLKLKRHPGTRKAEEKERPSMFTAQAALATIRQQLRLRQQAAVETFRNSEVMKYCEICRC